MSSSELWNRAQLDMESPEGEYDFKIDKFVTDEPCVCVTKMHKGQHWSPRGPA